MIKSKPWNWEISQAPHWEEPAGEVYPILSRWKEKKFKKFLDLGCGIGRHSILFAKNGFDVSAFDLGEAGLTKLKELADKENLKIEIKLGDMVSLPYKDVSFDCILAFHAIYHQDDEGIKKVIGEMNRVLKKGGEAFITFNSKSGWGFTSGEGNKVTENTIVKTSGEEAGIPHFYVDKKDVERLLSGFKILQFWYKEEYFGDSLAVTILCW